MSEPILSAHDLTRYFQTNKGVIKAVEGVDFEMHEGEVFGIVGESGSGKTTIGNMIIGIYPPSSGTLTYKGQNLSRGANRRSKELKRDIQMVFQNPASSLNPKRTVRQAIEVPLKVNKTGVSIGQRVDELLALVELPLEFAERYPGELGGGEKQLVSIARALGTNPSLLVLDEPTSALDVSIQAKMINVLLRLKERLGLSYIFITHNLSLMRNVADRVMIMYLGKVREIAPTEEFFRNPLHPYTKMLLSSIPVITEVEERAKPQRIVSTGEITGALNIPPGCSFHPRCPFVMDVCKSTDPPLLEIEKKHWVDCHLFPNEYNKTPNA
ncbi:MAG TPA: oligopeptide/dipeptide ABC transporter ATP-binding protein [Nitrososphaerales archaeon]|nr:oligopeptide/dipeptide ABC transporter ATP-binding protein [Nitrososphaerales archaeon]